MIKKVSGTCHCGSVNFYSETQPFWIGKCHCTDCQQVSGSGYLPYIGFKTDQLIVEGKTTTYISSAGVTRTFCPVCGSPITFHSEKYPDNYFIHSGNTHNSDDLEFKKHIWVGEKRRWDYICDDLPQE